MAWYRMHEGVCSDIKWPLIARKAKTNVGTVISIWVAILDHASQSEIRGSLDGFDPETINVLYGYEDGTCENVFEAMIEKGLISSSHVVNWEKRQPSREDATNAERQKRYRENHHSGMIHADKGITQRNAPITQDNDSITNSNADITHRNGTITQRNAPDKIREDKIINTPPLSPPKGVGCECAENFSHTHDPTEDKNSETGVEILPAKICLEAELLPAGIDQFFTNTCDLENYNSAADAETLCLDCENQQSGEMEIDFAENALLAGNNPVGRRTDSTSVTQFRGNDAEMETVNCAAPEDKTGRDRQIESRKRKNSCCSLQDLRDAINAFTSNAELQVALDDFRKMRERIRKPLTERALKLLFGELEKLAPCNDDLKVKILEQSIFHSWQGVFELRERKLFNADSVNMFSHRSYSQALSPGQITYLNGLKVIEEMEAQERRGVANGQ